MSAISVLGRLMEEGCGFQTSLDYLVTPSKTKDKENHFRKQVNDMYEYFSKEDMQGAGKYIKKCPDH